MMTTRSRHRFLLNSLPIPILTLGVLGWLVFAQARPSGLNRAMISAVKRDDTMEAMGLLVRGADPSARDFHDSRSSWQRFLDTMLQRPKLYQGLSALALAMERRNFDLVLVLTDAGADVNVTDEMNETLLGYACMYGETGLVKVLLAHGAKPNVRDASSQTPLSWAVDLDDIAAVEALTDYGADVNVTSGTGYSPLMVAAKDGQPRIVETLLAHHADVNYKDEHGDTALILASGIGNHSVAIAGMLLAKGADFRVKAPDGNTPLQMAQKNRDTALVRLILQAGARK